MRLRANINCTICGTRRSADDIWFLVVENRWEDTLKVLRWDEDLACAPGVHSACCVAHVQELVLHWMTTSSLNYPFASPPWLEASLGLPRGVWAANMKIGTGRAQVLGELALDREGVRRVLDESPHSLISLLVALKSALLQEPLQATEQNTAAGVQEGFQNI